ncbi:DUF5365 family protein [Bacillus sp. CRN 9]|nr:DUF5365 family protein [Bacillus sp. CRN 9]
MKVVFASTAEQEQQIEELVEKMYSDIFPIYFEEEEIKEFESMDILKPSKEYFGTLKEAYQVITGLQTILHILENNALKNQHETIFNKNVKILEEFGVSFPFAFHHFYEEKSLSKVDNSVYKANCEFLQ